MPKLKNITFIEKNNSGSSETCDLYCFICNVNFSNECLEKHLNNVSHVAAHKRIDVIFDTRREKVRCKLCDCALSWKMLKEHERSHVIIPWDRAEENYDKYKIFFDNSIVEWENSFRCCLCKVTFIDWSTALVHITDATHQSLKIKSSRQYDALSDIITDVLTYKLLVTEGLIASTLSNLECKICNGNGVSFVNILRHIKGLVHLYNRMKFEMNSEDNSNGEILTEEMSENQEIPSDTKETKHSALMYKSKITPDGTFSKPFLDYLVKRNLTELYCVICERKLSSNDKDSHLESEDHYEAMKQHDCEAISRKNANHHYCKVCDCTISCLANVYKHIKGKSHLTKCKRATQDSDELVDEVNIKSEDDTVSQSSTDFWIVNINDSDSRCVLCDCTMSSLSVKHNIHVTGNYHKNSLKIHGCENITIQGDVMYYCRCCDLEMSSWQSVHRHVKETSHMNSAMGNRVSTNEVTASKDLAAPKEANSFPNYYVVKIDDNNYRCLICDVGVTPSSSAIYEHITGETHLNLLKRYGCETISSVANDVYYCGTCKSTINGLEKVYLHVTKGRHLKLLESAGVEKSTKEMSKTGEKSLRTLNSIKCLLKNDAINNNSELPKVCAAPEDTLYVTLINDVTARCEICDCKISPSSCNITIHSMGKSHVSSFGKYGCEFIIRNDELAYNCNCCDVVLVNLDEVYRHVKTPRHVNSAISTRSRGSEKNNASSFQIDSRENLITRTNTGPSKRENIGNLNATRKISTKTWNYDNVISLGNENYLCACCNCNVCGFGNLQHHLNGKKHASAGYKRRLTSGLD